MIQLNHKDYVYDLIIDGNIGREMMSELLLYTQLKSLTLKNICIYDKDLDMINKLTELIEISFINCTFLNKIETLTNNNILKISFYGNDLRDYNLLSKMERLRYISIIDDKEVDLNNICKIPNLAELRVLNSFFLSTKELFKINKSILLEISGSKGVIDEEINALKTRFTFVDNGSFIIKEGDSSGIA